MHTVPYTHGTLTVKGLCAVPTVRYTVWYCHALSHGHTYEHRRHAMTPLRTSVPIHPPPFMRPFTAQVQVWHRALLMT
ncbi:hypothetical protein JB92DRAFT_2854523 [Gautieria morchelliformis]|nr:hypothetical protein JB92DRAFT_2854523 [Gautieria morchelliformis]